MIGSSTMPRGLMSRANSSARSSGRRRWPRTLLAGALSAAAVSVGVLSWVVMSFPVLLLWLGLAAIRAATIARAGEADAGCDRARASGSRRHCDDQMEDRGGCSRRPRQAVSGNISRACAPKRQGRRPRRLRPSPWHTIDQYPNITDLRYARNTKIHKEFQPLIGRAPHTGTTWPGNST